MTPCSIIIPPGKIFPPSVQKHGAFSPNPLCEGEKSNIAVVKNTNSRSKKNKGL